MFIASSGGFFFYAIGDNPNQLKSFAVSEVKMDSLKTKLGGVC
jgi:hypothetical protein